MRKFFPYSLLFMALVISPMILFSEKVPKRQFQLLLAPEEWDKIGDPEKFKDDLIILKDGSYIWGRFELVPPISYSFGKVEFDVDELAAIAFSSNLPQAKVQYITRNGQNYIGSLKQQNFPYKEKIQVIEKTKVDDLLPSGKEKVVSRKVKSEFYYMANFLQASSINMVIFAPRRTGDGKKIVGVPLVDPNFFSVILSEGDRFPAEVPLYEWHFKKGSDVYPVQVQNVIDLKIDPASGFKAVLKGESLSERSYFDGVQEPFLDILLAKDGKRFSIPWKKVKSVKGDMGMFVLSTPYLFGQKRIGNMAYIPAGSFILGSKLRPTASLKGFPKLILGFPLSQFTQAQLYTSKNLFPTIESPTELISLSGFYLDQYEVTNAQYFRFSQITGHRIPSHWQNGMYLEGESQLPVYNVSYEDALAYATWMGKRLPTEGEWERAAKGPLGYRYPYGDHFDPLKSNVFGETVLPVGTFAPFHDLKFFSPGIQSYEIFDLSGNVAEWTSSIFSSHKKIPATGQSEGYLVPPTGTRTRVVRGGSFRSSAHTATTTFRSGALEEDFNDSMGFRCVWDPNR